MKHPVDILEKVQKVGAPPFLYTRILSRIQNKAHEIVPIKWVAAAAACMLVLIVINISVIVNATTDQNTSSELSEAFSLQTSNSLYNE
jgi:hypothetical protein